MLRLIFIFLLLCVVSLLIGTKSLSLPALMSISDNSDVWLTLTASRIPRLIALVLTGVGLSVCGVILQHIVRNKFVEPATTGGLDSAKLGILVVLVYLPTASTLVKMLSAMMFCFFASLLYIALIKRIKFSNSVLIPVIGLMYGSVLTAMAEFYAYQHNIL